MLRDTVLRVYGIEGHGIGGTVLGGGGIEGARY